MTPARAFSVALVGVEGTIVEVESAIGGGLYFSSVKTKSRNPSLIVR